MIVTINGPVGQITNIGPCGKHFVKIGGNPWSVEIGRRVMYEKIWFTTLLKPRGDYLRPPFNRRMVVRHLRRPNEANEGVRSGRVRAVRNTRLLTLRLDESRVICLDAQKRVRVEKHTIDVAILEEPVRILLGVIEERRVPEFDGISAVGREKVQEIRQRIHRRGVECGREPYEKGTQQVFHRFE